MGEVTTYAAAYTAERPFHTALLAELDSAGSAFRHITPNWFASVMGTGIVATAAATLPLRLPGLHGFATAVWILAGTVLVVLTGAFATHWIRYREQAKAYAAHQVVGQFYGAPAMALLTVGAGALLFGPPIIGPSAALALDVVLWTAGTALGLVVALWLPFAMITREDHTDVEAVPAWMMPVVSPMVSASTGALLLSHLGPGQAGMTLLVGCYAMFGLSLLAGLITTTMVYSRLMHGGFSQVQAIPTVWIVLGVVGQSITAANLLPAHAGSVLTDAGTVSALHAFGIVYGLVMGGFGAFVFCLAAALTVHAARRGLSFSLTWWSFTFPVGTCVTGASALGAATGAVAISLLAVALYVLLLGAWATVATNTVRGVRSGRLLRG
ncbi:TDT family transporter [Mycolicibacterium boenickei]|uniref:TDT family transporter n=1 Tax=Mycolicibacterium boenickei TaxID=146017 RepID=A0AAX3A7K8_9MYCO|nr:TDT family transporter [Mycolicibacterium boenickei]PEG58518.1 C4-dicarboxylate ABC transporter [Mycolicibacterium boenickei]UNC03023.1 TDT family transporter [Mycolicibacterium boenickei]